MESKKNKCLSLVFSLFQSREKTRSKNSNEITKTLEDKILHTIKQYRSDNIDRILRSNSIGDFLSIHFKIVNISLAKENQIKKSLG